MSDRCQTIIDEATGAVCGHRLGEHHMRTIKRRTRVGRFFMHYFPCTYPNDTSGTIPPSCPCENFTPEGT